jgi:hypothetical protein
MEQQCLKLFSSFSIPKLRVLVEGILSGPHYWNRRKQDILDHIFRVVTPEVLEALFRKAKEMKDPMGQHDASASGSGALKRKKERDHSDEDSQVRVGCFSRVMLTQELLAQAEGDSAHSVKRS